MNKRLLALAVAAAVCAPTAVFADDSTVTVYGTLNMDFDHVEADGCQAPGCTNQAGKNRVVQNSSNIGFRGAEDLGGGLKTVFQIEQGVNLNSGTASAAAGTWATRNSKLGLAGNFGEVFFGNWDTPYKSSTILGPIDAWYNTGVAYYGDIISGDSTPTTPNVANRRSFDRRENNVVEYITPDLSGFTGRVSYAADQERTGTGAGPDLWSVSGAWTGGPLYLALAWERHNQYANNAFDQTRDTGVKLDAAFTFPTATTIGFIAERLKYDGALATGALCTAVGGCPVAGGGAAAFGTLWVPGVAAGSSIAGIPAGFTKSITAGTEGTSPPNEATVDAYYLSLVQRFGPHAIRADYAWDRGMKLSGGNGSSDSGTKAKQWSLGYSYSLSKRTDLYALYTEIKNEDHSANDFAVNPVIGGGEVGAGAKPKSLGAGIRHTF